ncbi:unnamed protein product [Timema podura]|uniref:Glutathione synthetase n=1 Tax=Timema podura TaxID=61482 RepID=A0ABN7NXZ5_TIMPD|nr:unnamed protein product [Timema podura]
MIRMSTPRLESCIPLPLGDDVLEEIVDKARDWALMHGAAMRSKDNFSKDLLQLAPFVLLPSPFPRKEFEKAVSIQPILNELMHKVAHSHDFLVASLKSTIEVDEFTRKLFEIYETVNREGVSQTNSTPTKHYESYSNGDWMSVDLTCRLLAEHVPV